MPFHQVALPRLATPDEAREVIEISLDLLDRRTPEYELQRTRSKKSLE